jgi:hypothetical protein
VRVVGVKDQDYEDEAVRVVDWKCIQENTLEKVDTQLEAFGLEVVKINDFSDCHMWRIERRSE